MRRSTQSNGPLNSIAILRTSFAEAFDQARDCPSSPWREPWTAQLGVGFTHSNSGDRRSGNGASPPSAHARPLSGFALKRSSDVNN